MGRDVLNGHWPLDFTDFGIPFFAAGAVFLVATCGWLLLHLKGRRPGWLGYAVLAISAVIVTQMLVSAPILIFGLKAGTIDFIQLTASILTMHGQYSLPIALVATALFVWWLRRDAKARPSRRVGAGWRS
jgi:hypothetical protein